MISPPFILARRFVAGETLDEAIAAARACNNAGMLVSLDYLGENSSTTSDAQKARDSYLEVFERIALEKLHANVSCKLTQLGLDLNVDFCQGLVRSIAERAAAYDNFLRIDMESSLYTQRTVDLVKRVRSSTPAVGTVIQSYLYRSETDIQDLLAYGCRIRLCKGAYKEGPEVAFPAKADVDANYVELMKRMVTFHNPETGKGVFCGIATHDEVIVDQMRAFVREHNIDKHAFEFQMLYGVRRDLQRKLAAEGFGVRVYIPFGPEWYPYFMRRLAERPANVIFLAKNFFKN